MTADHKSTWESLEPDLQEIGEGPRRQATLPLGVSWQRQNAGYRRWWKNGVEVRVSGPTILMTFLRLRQAFSSRDGRGTFIQGA